MMQAVRRIISGRSESALTGRSFSRSVCSAMVATLTIASLCAMPALAQLPQTRLGAVTPPGGQVGTTFDLVVSAGTDLDELDRLIFSHPGITATQKMNGTGENAAPVDKTFTVTIDKSVPPGRYEVRTSGLYGISNPRFFVVSATPEISEKEPNNTPEQATPLEIEQTANALCNGAADVDFYKFTGTSGQRLFVRCLADRIDSQLRPTLELFNGSGRLVAFARHNERRDALLDYQLPADGDYYVKVSDLTFAGGTEHFYRMQVTQAPHIDFILPPAGVAGTTGNFTVYGRGLPGGKPAGVELEGRPLEQLSVSIPLPDSADTLSPGSFLSSVQAGIDGFFYTLDSPAGRSNPVLIQFSSAPVGLEQEPNDTAEQASPLTVPGEIAGQFQNRGDVDWYTLEAKAGNVYFIEVYGERGGSSADPLFALERVQKKDDGTETVSQITLADDTSTNLGVNQFDTYTNDPAYRFVVPQDGTYRIAVRDRYFEARGNQELVYRLAVREESPDFRVVAVPLAPAVNNALVAGPSSLSLRKGDTIGVNVMAFRQDGFDGPIDVTAVDLPKGVTTSGTTIGAGQTSAMMVLTSAEDAAPWQGTVNLKATARVEKPDLARALDTAIKQIKQATDALPKLQEAVDKAAAAHKPLAEQAEKAKAAAAKDAENKTLAAQAEQAQQKADAAAKVLEQAQAALQAGQKKLADAEAAVEAARKANEAAIRKVEHTVRPGTVLRNAVANTAPDARVAQSFSLSVTDELAPFQLTSDVMRFEGGQNYQILVPVKLVRRNGFENPVTVAVTGLPNNAQIQVQVAPIKKEDTEALYRLFINGNAPEATYSVYLSGQAPVSYSRNPAAAERAKAKAEAATAALTAAQEAQKKAAAERDAAVKAATEADNAVKQATAEVTKQKQEEQKAAAALQQATEEQKKLAADAEADDAKKQAAAKKLEEAQAASKKAAEDVAAAEKALAEAQAAMKAAAEAKTKAEAAVTAADATVKTADAAKKAADKVSTDAANAAKPKNTNVMVASVPLIIQVRKAPVTLTAAVPAGGALKKGASTEIKVTVKRQNDFTGPVKLSLPEVHGVSGLSAPEVTIPADATEGVLTVTAAGDATEGQLANLVIRATAEFQNVETSVDAPVKINVTK